MTNEEQRKRLDSWKEIADYLERDVRTVLRWEKERGLPVRRLPGGKRQSVFAFTGEIDAWLKQQEGSLEGVTSPSTEAAGSNPASVNTGIGARPAPRALQRMILSAGVLVVLVLLGWFAATRMRESSGLNFAREVSFETPAGPLRFVPSKIETAPPVYRLAAADLNSDGAVDLVFSTAPEDVVGVMLGKGDGSFSPARLYGRCPHSDSVAIADFNRDGNLDIAVTCTVGNFLLVLGGRGDGTFLEHGKIPVTGGPRFLAAGDLNGDGWPDLAVSSFGEPALWILTNRAGRFTTARVARFEGAADPAVADLDGDGFLDIVLCVRAEGRFALALFPGKGDGSFLSHRLLRWDDAPRAMPWRVRALDLDGDGLMDLVFSLWGESEPLFFSRGAGRGEFSRPAGLPGVHDLRGSWTYAPTDLDLDGNLDLLVADSQAGTLWFLSERENGTFAPAGPLPVGNYLMDPVIADFDRDGLPDIIVNAYWERSTILLRAAWKKQPARQERPDHTGSH